MDITRQATRPELLAADDAVIDDAIGYAEPMVLRGLLYQLTGDPEVAATGVKIVHAGYVDLAAPATDEDVALLRRKAAAFLKSYRDSGAGAIDIGPRARLADSLSLLLGRRMEGESLQHHLEELALDPKARALRWQEAPDPARLKDFTVTVIGAGMGGLNAALQLREAGFKFTVLEKNTAIPVRGWIRSAAAIPISSAWISPTPIRIATGGRTPAISTGWPTISTCAGMSASRLR